MQNLHLKTPLNNDIINMTQKILLNRQQAEKFIEIYKFFKDTEAFYLDVKDDGEVMVTFSLSDSNTSNTLKFKTAEYGRVV